MRSSKLWSAGSTSSQRLSGSPAVRRPSRVAVNPRRTEAGAVPCPASGTGARCVRRGEPRLRVRASAPAPRTAATPGNRRRIRPRGGFHVKSPLRSGKSPGFRGVGWGARRYAGIFGDPRREDSNPLPFPRIACRIALAPAAGRPADGAPGGCGPVRRRPAPWPGLRFPCRRAAAGDVGARSYKVGGEAPDFVRADLAGGTRSRVRRAHFLASPYCRHPGACSPRPPSGRLRYCGASGGAHDRSES